MRTYQINLSHIPSQESDSKFFNKVLKHNFEWWRYYPLSFILLTPDNIYTNTLISWITESYGPIFFTVIEIDIKDVGGIFPASQEYYKAGGQNPFEWFYRIRDPKFIPKWEREKQKEDNDQ